MREYLELRVNESHAGLIFDRNEGKQLSDHIRKITIATSDPRMSAIRDIRRSLSKAGESLFYGWSISREYEQHEIEQAELFQLLTQAYFEPPGEDCGTIYDDSVACQYVFHEGVPNVAGTDIHLVDSCGAGFRQLSELFVDFSRIPKSADIACSIANEVVVSEQLASALLESALTGFELKPAHDWNTEVKRTLRVENRVRRKHRQQWRQFVITAPVVSIGSETKVGIDPFDLDPNGQYRCPFGHVVGLNLLSELVVLGSGYDGRDVFCTKELFGVRRGLLRPRPAILIRPKFFEFLREHDAKGYRVEVAHFSEGN